MANPPSLLKKALSHPDSGPFFMEIPHPSLGPLVFAFANQGEMERVLSETVKRASQEDIKSIFLIVGAKKAEGDMDAANRLVGAFIQRHPLCAMVHLLRAQLAEDEGSLDAAAWSARQSVALQPTYRALATLGRIRGKQNALEEALAIFTHLQANHAEAPTKNVAINTVKEALVTLTRLQRGEEMVRVADAAIEDLGPASVFHYHAVLGLIIAGRLPEAVRRLEGLEGRLSPQDPLVPKFAQMKAIALAKLGAGGAGR